MKSISWSMCAHVIGCHHNSYTLCNPVPELRSLFPLVSFLFPRPLLHNHYFSILHSNLNPLIHSRNSVCPTLPDLHALSLSTLTKDPVIPSWTYSSPFLRS